MPVMILSPVPVFSSSGTARRMFVATRSMQGARANDFFEGVEGEFVIFPYRSCPDASVDDQCGCKRSLVGIQSDKTTTTMKVVVCPTDVAIIKMGIRRHLQRTGEWEEIAKDLEPENYLATLTDTLLEKAKDMLIGTVVEYRDDTFRERSTADRGRGN